jgi:hypothetical protein
MQTTDLKGEIDELFEILMVNYIDIDINAKLRGGVPSGFAVVGGYGVSLVIRLANCRRGKAIAQRLVRDVLSMQSFSGVILSEIMRPRLRLGEHVLTYREGVLRQ